MEINIIFTYYILIKSYLLNTRVGCSTSAVEVVLLQADKPKSNLGKHTNLQIIHYVHIYNYTNYTLCAPANTFPENCCKDIANEVENYVDAYETLSTKTGK